MKHFFMALGAALIGFATVPALAQAPPPPPPGTYIDTACGSWQNDVWVPNGTCPARIRHAALTGTIVGVNGHLVTLQQSGRQVVINDQPALDRQQTGKVANGRMVVAYGYWMAGTFYATAIY